MEYRDLAPTNNIQNGQEYINALQWALENPKIKNIALAGPYGSGKSSIIDTYIERQRQECKEKDKKCHCKKEKHWMKTNTIKFQWRHLRMLKTVKIQTAKLK